MKKFEYTITDEVGIHARPAGMLAKLAKSFESSIVISRGDKSVNAAQLMMLMGMGIKKGDHVTLTIEGADEEEAFAALEQFFKENL